MVHHQNRNLSWWEVPGVNGPKMSNNNHPRRATFMPILSLDLERFLLNNANLARK